MRHYTSIMLTPLEAEDLRERILYNCDALARDIGVSRGTLAKAAARLPIKASSGEAIRSYLDSR